MAGEGSKTQFAIIDEVEPGVTPTGVPLEIVRSTDNDIAYRPEQTSSREISTARAVTDEIRTGAQVSGTLNTEIPFGNLEKLILGALQSDAATAGALGSASFGSQNVNGPSTVDFTSNQIQGTGIGVGIGAGDLIQVAGADDATNNGFLDVTARTDDSITVSQTLVPDVGDAGVVVSNGAVQTNGSLLRTFTGERIHRDAAGVGSDLTDVFTGLAVESMSVNVQPGSILTAAWCMRGEIYSAGTSEIGSTPYSTPSASGPIFNGVNNCIVLLGGTQVTGNAGVGATQFTMELQNGLQPRDSIGVEGSASIGNGTLSVSGQLNIYMNSNTEVQRMIDDGETSIAVLLVSGSGTYGITLPRIKYRAAPRNVQGVNTNTILELNYGALNDADLGYAIKWQKWT